MSIEIQSFIISGRLRGARGGHLSKEDDKSERSTILPKGGRLVTLPFLELFVITI